MKKHIKNHSVEERKSHTIKKNLTRDVISSFVKQKAIPRPEIWNIASKRDGFLEQVVYHLDKYFVPFASVENPAYKKMHGHKKGYYKDGDKFSKVILNLESEFQESIKIYIERHFYGIFND